MLVINYGQRSSKWSARWWTGDSSSSLLTEPPRSPQTPRNMFFKLWPWILACRLVLSFGMGWVDFFSGFLVCTFLMHHPKNPRGRRIIHIIVAVLFSFLLRSFQRCLYLIAKNYNSVKFIMKIIIMHVLSHCACDGRVYLSAHIFGIHTKQWSWPGRFCVIIALARTKQSRWRRKQKHSILGTRICPLGHWVSVKSFSLKLAVGEKKLGDSEFFLKLTQFDTHEKRNDELCKSTESS